MNIFQGTDAVNEGVLSTVTAMVAQQSNSCIKILEPSGKIAAVNGRGLELLGTTANDLCGQIWSTLWGTDMQDVVQTAVQDAFDGHSSAFHGDFDRDGQTTKWEIEVFPINQTGAITSAIAISRPVTPTKSYDEKLADLEKQLHDARHLLANLANITASSARMLKRSPDQDIIDNIADGLAQAGKNATEAMNKA